MDGSEKELGAWCVLLLVLAADEPMVRLSAAELAQLCVTALEGGADGG